jgi:hypothetical protein
MTSVEQTPEKASKRRIFDSIISPSQSIDKKRKELKNKIDKDRGNDNNSGVEKRLGFDIVVDSSEGETGKESLDVKVKCLEIVFPNQDRYGVNVSVLSTVGDLIAECMEKSKSPLEEKFHLMSEDDKQVDDEMPSMELNFEATYYLKVV